MKIDNAFEMLDEITIGEKGASSIWLAKHFGVNQKTAWAFRGKVQRVMKSSKQYPLKGAVHVDEFELGTPKQGEPGRSKSQKKMRVVIAVEEREGRSGRAYAKLIHDYSVDSLRRVFDDHI